MVGSALPVTVSAVAPLNLKQALPVWTNESKQPVANTPKSNVDDQPSSADGWDAGWDDIAVPANAPVISAEPVIKDQSAAFSDWSQKANSAPESVSPPEATSPTLSASKEDRAAVMAKKKEERRARIEALKQQRKSAMSGGSTVNDDNDGSLI